MAIVFALAAAAFVALALRLPGLLATALAGYLALVVDVVVVTWMLSPFRAVTQWGLLASQLVVLGLATAAWWLRGRPLVSLAPARVALRELDLVTIAFLAVVGVALAYELVLALTVPPTNFDSLTYHLSRVAWWKQVGGIHWITNAPTGRMNEFQPLAEQQILFLFVATGSTVPYALPQFAAELAILAAVFGVARRLGFSVRAAAGAAALTATLNIVALEATTAQNDLVAAFFPLLAVFFLLGGGPVEAVLAGVAAGVGLGVKLTTILVLPVLLWLAWQGGRRTLRWAVAGGVGGFVACSLWGYVLNLVHTGHVLGKGQGRVEDTASFGVGGTIDRFAHLVLRLFELGELPHWLVLASLGVGVALGLAVAAYVRRPLAVAVAWPFVAPIVVLAVLAVFSGHDPTNVPRDANEDYAAFGPVGGAAVLGAFLLGVTVWRRDRRRLAVALALPCFLVLLASYAAYNIWITRFFAVPGVLIAPLFAGFFRWRVAAAATAVAASVALGFTLIRDGTKPLDGRSGHPWALTQASALAESPAHDEGLELAATLAAYARQVPADACVGAVTDPDEPAYLLYGPDLRHRVVYISSLDAVVEADIARLSYVVISTGANAPVADQFRAAGWHVGPLGPYWQLAAMMTRPRGCSSVG